jgi:hypothetical protein
LDSLLIAVDYPNNGTGFPKFQVVNQLFHVSTLYQELVFIYVVDMVFGDSYIPPSFYRRRKAIYNYLIGQKINRKRLSYKGFGTSKPLHPIPEKSSQEEEENRRVEILIMEN